MTRGQLGRQARKEEIEDRTAAGRKETSRVKRKKEKRKKVKGKTAGRKSQADSERDEL